MDFRNEEYWKKGLALNTDDYGGEVYRYAEAWADLMENEISQGKELKEIAKQTSHTADSEGITGYMYGTAVSILAKCWVHGEELRLWSNLDIQVGTEGEKANENGDTLNPALISIVG